ncbi:hypothetical protein BLS_008455 [Venturia inaequalis]|uniref:Uncharacterized protein n=1 Tax=Venturia inaequalis TaxID=5025 RepID=A0A8H3U6Q3_VENIN|nr:hypothetical protein BLS_008455 [Venturia inaequalis]RDI81391.1 hypothetical protein Vi05172_g8711 [Venturia inaequalis]
MITGTSASFEALDTNLASSVDRLYTRIYSLHHTSFSPLPSNFVASLLPTSRIVYRALSALLLNITCKMSDNPPPSKDEQDKARRAVNENIINDPAATALVQAAGLSSQRKRQELKDKKEKKDDK